MNNDRNYSKNNDSNNNNNWYFFRLFVAPRFSADRSRLLTDAQPRNSLADLNVFDAVRLQHTSRRRLRFDNFQCLGVLSVSQTEFIRIEKYIKNVPNNENERA